VPSICRLARYTTAWGRTTNALFRDLLSRPDARDPTERYTRLDVVVDDYRIHQAKAVEQWLAVHPRFTILWLPTYCPRTTPIERAFGDVHDGRTRKHRRTHLPNLAADVEDHLHLDDPWQYQLLELYYAPAVTASVARIAAEEYAAAAVWGVPMSCGLI
jgi:hypothetical protein